MSAADSPASRIPASRGFLAGWTAFWFTPADPTPLALIRLLSGLVTLYTIVIYGFTLDVFHGEHAFLSAELRREVFRDRSIAVSALSGRTSPAPAPSTDFEREYFRTYLKKWGQEPPGPYPANQAEADFADRYVEQFAIDFRTLGLPFPTDERQRRYILDYSTRYRLPPPPPYPPEDEALAREQLEQVDAFWMRHQADLRNLYTRGMGIWSVFLDVTDPTWQRVIHGLFVAAAFCMCIGLGTRVAVPLTWFANLCYIHRNTTVLFGVDTMMNIVLLYLMIGPSGAALSVDRLIGRRRNPHPPEPSLTANLAIRLLQVHLCIIYFVAGISKLQGMSWWNGGAVWSVLANFEFAPMQSEFYCAMLRFLGRNQLVLEGFLTSAGYLTLAFEIAYPFLIWRPSTRWLLLAGALWLHGFIGLFMGLKTFSLLMLIFNGAFLKPQEVHWLLSWFRSSRTDPANQPATPVSA